MDRIKQHAKESFRVVTGDDINVDIRVNDEGMGVISSKRNSNRGFPENKGCHESKRCHENEGSKSKFRITGRLGRSNDDRYLLSYAATVNDVPVSEHVTEISPNFFFQDIFDNERACQKSSQDLLHRDETDKKASIKIKRTEDSFSSSDDNISDTKGKTKSHSSIKKKKKSNLHTVQNVDYAVQCNKDCCKCININSMKAKIGNEHLKHVSLITEPVQKQDVSVQCDLNNCQFCSNKVEEIPNDQKHLKPDVLGMQNEKHNSSQTPTANDILQMLSSVYDKMQAKRNTNLSSDENISFDGILNRKVPDKKAMQNEAFQLNNKINIQSSETDISEISDSKGYNIRSRSKSPVKKHKMTKEENSKSALANSEKVISKRSKSPATSKSPEKYTATQTKRNEYRNNENNNSASQKIVASRKQNTENTKQTNKIRPVNRNSLHQKSDDYISTETVTNVPKQKKGNVPKNQSPNRYSPSKQKNALGDDDTLYTYVKQDTATDKTTKPLSPKINSSKQRGHTKIVNESSYKYTKQKTEMVSKTNSPRQNSPQQKSVANKNVYSYGSQKTIEGRSGSKNRLKNKSPQQQGSDTSLQKDTFYNYLTPQRRSRHDSLELTTKPHKTSEESTNKVKRASNVSIYVDSDNEYYNLSFQRDHEITNLTITKILKSQGTQKGITPSLENLS